MIMMKWKKRTLFLLVTAVTISAAVVACVFLIPPVRKRLEKRDKSNTTYSDKIWSQTGFSLLRNNKTCEDCTVVGARMINFMDQKADKCSDFYKYACGNFGKHHSTPENWKFYNWHDVYSKNLDLTVKSILEESDTVNQTDSLTKAKIVYRTCIDTDLIDKNSVSDLRDVLSNTGIGEWPFLKTDWNDCRLDVEWRMAKLNAMGLDSLFQLDIQYGEGEPNKLNAVLRLAEPLVDGICSDPLPDNISVMLQERTSEHRQILESVLRLLDVDMNNVTEQDIDDLFEFDFMFCNATKESRLNGSVQDISSLNITLTDFAGISTQINWLRWRNLIFSELDLGFPHNKQYIYVDDIEPAINGINHLLQKSSSKVQANYLTWRFILNHLGFLSKKFRHISELYAGLLGPRRLKPMQTGPDRLIQERWRQCVLLIKNLMPLALVRPFSDSIKMESRMEEMENVISMISDEYKHIISSNHMIAQEQRTSNQMIDIIRHRTYLTYPFKEERFFSEFYMDAGITRSSFLKNGLKLRNRRMKNLLEGSFRDKMVDDMEYAIQTIYSPFDPEMYSFFRGKQIVVSLGALQYCPVKGVPIPKSVTLSTFGWMYAHELAHGFDLRALNSSTGQNWTVWHSSVLKHPKEKAMCFLNQNYSMYHNMNLDKALETSTLIEDMVDQQALTLAHRAYLHYLNKSADEQTLPNIQLTSQKLFFVSYAQQFCEAKEAKVSTSTSTSDRRTLNAHTTTSPGHRRVNDILKKYPPFARTFNCQSNTPMNKPACQS